MNRIGKGSPEGAKAQRVYLSLREDFNTKVYSSGQYLLGEIKLASAFEVSRVTVRRALDALCRDGLIERRAGSGTVVRDIEPVDAPDAMNFNTLMPQLAEMGRNTTAKLFVTDKQGDGVEYLIAHYRPDLFTIDMTLARVGDGNHRYWEPTIAVNKSLDTSIDTSTNKERIPA